MSRKRRVGLTRLSVYVRDQRGAHRAARAGRRVHLGGAGRRLAARAATRSTTASARTTPSRLDLDVAIYVGVNAAAWLVGSFLIIGLAQLGQLIVLRLREHLFGHLTTLSLRYFSEQRAGWIISRITNDVDALSDVLSEGLSTLVGNVLTLTGAMIALAILDWRLALATMVILPPTHGRRALVPDPLAHGLRRRPHAHLGAHGARRGVARGHGRDPVLQPRGHVPQAVPASSTAPTSAPTSTPRTSRRCSSRRSSCSA